MQDVRAELASDRFMVTVSPSGPTVEELLRAVKAIGFEPQMYTGNTSAVSTEKPVTELPARVIDALALANSTSKRVLITFGADWCGPCKRMKKETYGDPEVKKLLTEEFVVLNVNTDEEPGIAIGFRVKAIPELQVLDASGLGIYRTQGFKNPKELLLILKEVLNDKVGTQNKSAIQSD